MLSVDTEILEFNIKNLIKHNIIYADLSCIIWKTVGCKNNPEYSSTTNVSKHISSGFSISLFANI